MGDTIPRDARLQRRAYRMAGRAVMCIIQQRHFLSVSVTDDTDPGGMRMAPTELIDNETGGLDREEAEREMLIDLAGPIAYKVSRGKREWRGTGRDLLGAPKAVDLAAQLRESHEAARAYLKDLWLQARDTLVEPGHWLAVQNLAGELVEQRQLSEERATQLFNESAREVK